jgi:hypothetical protein
MVLPHLMFMCSVQVWISIVCSSISYSKVLVICFLWRWDEFLAAIFSINLLKKRGLVTIGLVIGFGLQLKIFAAIFLCSWLYLGCEYLLFHASSSALICQFGCVYERYLLYIWFVNVLHCGVAPSFLWCCQEAACGLMNFMVAQIMHFVSIFNIVAGSNRCYSFYNCWYWLIGWNCSLVFSLHASCGHMLLCSVVTNTTRNNQA